LVAATAAALDCGNRADWPLQGKYIVVVEDDLTILDGLVRAVGDAGGLAEGADSIDTVRRLFANRDRCPDILVTDMLLGAGATGLDAVAALRERFEWAAAVPVLFVTGDLQPWSKLAGLTGRFNIQHKPINLDALLAKMCKLLSPPPE
jgi:DNA-binding response OmpR family regulator